MKNLFRITCGRCQNTAPLADWQTVASGPLEPNEFQCPQCHYAFRREPNPNRKNSWDRFIVLTPIQPRLL